MPGDAGATNPVDDRRINAYLQPVMLRRLLTLLAILSGLTAIGAPAHARISALEEIQLEASGERASVCEGRQLALPQGPLDLLGGHKAHGPSCPRPAVTVVIPTVQLGADRARE